MLTLTDQNQKTLNFKLLSLLKYVATGNKLTTDVIPIRNALLRAPTPFQSVFPLPSFLLPCFVSDAVADKEKIENEENERTDERASAQE